MRLSITAVAATAALLCCIFSTMMATPAAAIDLVEIATAEEYERFALGDEHHAALIFFYASWNKHTLDIKKIFVEAAERMTQEHVHGLVMGMVDVGKYPALARRVGVKGLPGLYLYQFGLAPRIFSYGFHDGFTVEAIMEFATHETDVHRAHLTKLREAREEKERTHYDFPHPSPGKVVELTAHNFNRVIRDPTKMGFVMYYASWCEICKNTMPEVERVAKYFENVTEIVIARMDVDENQEWLEANGLGDLEGVPVFYNYPRGRRDKEKGWQYLGERDFESMSHYVNDNSRKDEEDIDEFHRDIIANKPDDNLLPENMRGTFSAKDAMPAELFDEKGFPHGEPLGGMKPIHKMNNVKEGRARSRRLQGLPPEDDEETLSGLTEEEKEERKRIKEEKRKKKEAANQEGFSGKLPPEMRGKATD